MLAEFFNHGRVVVGGHGLGLAAAAIEEAWEFVHDREAFGKTVDEFQAVQPNWPICNSASSPPGPSPARGRTRRHQENSGYGSH